MKINIEISATYKRCSFFITSLLEDLFSIFYLDVTGQPFKKINLNTSLSAGVKRIAMLRYARMSKRECQSVRISAATRSGPCPPRRCLPE